MSNRRPQMGGRRMEFNRNDRGKNFARPGVSPWQGGGPGAGLPNLLPLSGGPTEATLALASNIINLLHQPRQNPVPSLLDMPIRRDFGGPPNMGRFDRGFNNNRMGNQNFRRTGNYNRAGERMNNNRKPFRPNDGQRQQNKSTPKKEADSKAKPVKESEDKPAETATTDSKETEKKDTPKTRYDDIHPQLLKCHICNKSMWDGRSFENHLSGRAHAIMMQKTAESYALTADTMRQEFKIREMKRTRKTGQQPARDFYCAMCDMYAADGAAHRTTVGHRKLKKYLHPTCTGCHKEMPTRIELDEHRLTAEHLKNMQDKQEVVSKPKPEMIMISTLSMEQTYVREDRQRRRRDDREKDGDDKEETQVKQEKDGENETEEGTKNGDGPDTILDYKEGDDLTGITSAQFPAYSTERGVGASFLAPFSCVQCHLCRKLLDGPEAAEVHLKTWRHHQLFVRMLGDAKVKKENTTEQPDTYKRPAQSEDGGNWKRRKTNNGENGDEQEQDGDEQEQDADEQEQDGEGDDDQNQEQPSLDADGDAQMTNADDLDDWEHSVDEILMDEQANNGENDESQAEEVKTEPEEESVVEPEPEPEQKPTPTPAKPKNSPRGRGRGRGRRY